MIAERPTVKVGPVVLNGPQRTFLKGCNRDGERFFVRGGNEFGGFRGPGRIDTARWDSGPHLVLGFGGSRGLFASQVVAEEAALGVAGEAGFVLLNIKQSPVEGGHGPGVAGGEEGGGGGDFDALGE